MRLPASLSLILPSFISISISLTHALALPPSSPPITTIYEFPNNTWVENLAIRSNGNILVTLITSPEVWEINPLTKAASLIAHFPSATSALGIAEIEHDRFAVAVGNWSDVTDRATAGSWSVWSVDLSSSNTNADADTETKRTTTTGNHNPNPRINKVIDLPDALFLNGATNLPTRANTVLVSDSAKGVVWLVDTQTGASEIAIDVPEMKPNTSAPLVLGVNGIHYRGEYLYFVNTFSHPTYSRIPLSASGSPSGPVEPILFSPTFPLDAINAAVDDFALDGEGNAWIVNPSNTLFKVTPQGKATVIAGGPDELVLVGSTSAAFGRAGWQTARKTLYITSDGGIPAPLGDVRPGKVLSVETAGF